VEAARPRLEIRQLAPIAPRHVGNLRPLAEGGAFLMSEATERDSREARQAAATEEEMAAERAEESGAEREGEPARNADEIEALRRQADENWTKYLRAVAELDNYRKRSAR